MTLGWKVWERIYIKTSLKPSKCARILHFVRLWSIASKSLVWIMLYSGKCCRLFQEILFDQKLSSTLWKKSFVSHKLCTPLWEFLLALKRQFVWSCKIVQSRREQFLTLVLSKHTDIELKNLSDILLIRLSRCKRCN